MSSTWRYLISVYLCATNLHSKLPDITTTLYSETFVVQYNIIQAHTHTHPQTSRHADKLLKTQFLDSDDIKMYNYCKNWISKTLPNNNIFFTIHWRAKVKRFRMICSIYTETYHLYKYFSSITFAVLQHCFILKDDKLIYFAFYFLKKLPAEYKLLIKNIRIFFPN